MASAPRSQPASFSQGRHGGNASGGSNTAPMNDLTIEVIEVTNPGGVLGEDSFGNVTVGNDADADNRP